MKTVKDNPELGNIDFSNAKSVSEVPALARLQAKRKAEREHQQPNPIDADVWQLIISKADNHAEMARVNSVLRAMLA